MRKIGRVLAGAMALALFLAVPALILSGAAFGARHTTLRASSHRASVLVYHAIADLEDDPVLSEFAVPPKRFAEQLDALRERGWRFVDLDSVLDDLNGGDSLPAKSVLLTFDDAYSNLRDEACPILNERGIPAVAFAVAEKVGGTNEWDKVDGSAELELLCPDGLRDVAQRGVEIGSHTATHRPLTEVPLEQLDQELHGSAKRLDALGLPRPRAFAYPYGRWNEEVAKAVRDAGYEVAFTVDRGTVEQDSDLHALPRLAVHADDTGRILHLKLKAGVWPPIAKAALRLADRMRTAVRSKISP